MKRLSAISLLVCVACVTTKEEGEKMRARIDTLEKDVKTEKEKSAADRQKPTRDIVRARRGRRHVDGPILP